MCFNYKISVITTFLIYASIGKIILFKKIDKGILYCVLGIMLTTGIVEPLEGIIHFRYMMNQEYIFLSEYLEGSIRLQPYFSLFLFLLIGINKKYNKFIYLCIFIQLVIDMSFCSSTNIKIINDNGMNKLSWDFMNNYPNYYYVFYVISCFVPLLIGAMKYESMKILLYFQIIISIIAMLLTRLSLINIIHTGSLWCLLQSIGLFLI